jgi:hypothetical protein
VIPDQPCCTRIPNRRQHCSRRPASLEELLPFWPTWDEWLRSLEEGDRAAALVLRDRLAALGAEDAESWARSEVSEGIRSRLGS